MNNRALKSVTDKYSLYGAKSLDNLTTTPLAQPDPFDTSQFWPVATTAAQDRPSFNLGASSLTQMNNESHRYSTNNYANTAPSSANNSLVYNNMTLNSNNRMNGSYGLLPNIYGNTSTDSFASERNTLSQATSIASNLADMSLDDRISASLNLGKNTNSENIYSNSSYYNEPPTTSAGAGSNQLNGSRYGEDLPLYGNFDINPTQQQFILETKDYYTKLSTSERSKPNNHYEKNTYVPKHKDDSEKLRCFSDSIKNSKNYSPMKYENQDYYNYSASEYSANTNGASTSQATYDEVNDTMSNVYSEIGDEMYSNARLYDDVYESTAAPRPHRPAPPCPSKPK